MCKSRCALEVLLKHNRHVGSGRHPFSLTGADRLLYPSDCFKCTLAERHNLKRVRARMACCVYHIIGPCFMRLETFEGMPTMRPARWVSFEATGHVFIKVGTMKNTT